MASEGERVSASREIRFPKTRTWDFQNKQEADEFFEAKIGAYRQDKQGYGRLSVLLRKLNQEGKETERTRFLIIK